MSENNQLDMDFIQFISEQVTNIKHPMSLSEFCRQFKKKGRISSSECKLSQRLQRIRDRMSEIENFDTETKVKMMFVLGSPVSNGCLIELTKEADVKLDNQHRIIKYKKHGKGLQLSGAHTGTGRSCDREVERKILKFLAQKSANATSPITDKDFLKEFMSSEGSLKSERNLYARYNLFKQQIYLAAEFDQVTKIRMMFVSSTKIHACILDELRQTADVEVEDQIIIKYKAHDGSLELEGMRSYKGWSKEEIDKLLNFLAEKSKQTKLPLLIKPLCKEFVEKNGISRTFPAVGIYIHHTILPKISKLNDFDIETRIRMMFGLSAPVDGEFLNELEKEAVVEIDEKRRIIKYTANDGSLKLKGDHSGSAKKKIVDAQRKRKNGFSEASENDEKTDNDDDEEAPQNNRALKRRLNVTNKSSLENENQETEAISQNNAKRRRESQFEVDFQTMNLSEETIETSSEAEGPTVDVIYEGPGEPPRPFLLPRKRETIEEEITFVANSDSISSIKFLKLIRTLIRDLDSPILVVLQEEIDSKIKELRGNGVKVSINTVLHALESIVHIVQNHASTTISIENSTSFKEFLLMLRTVTFNLTSPELADFQKALKGVGNYIENQNKRIPFEKIRHGLEYAIAYVIS